MHITYTNQAAEFLTNVPMEVDSYITRSIRSLAPVAGSQMVVIGLTADGGNDHVWRVFKLYATRPSLRCIFHRDMRDGSVTVEYINWRDCNPYGDGH